MSDSGIMHENQGIGKEMRTLSFTRDDLDRVLQSPDYSPMALIKLFGQDFNDEYSADAGVKEGYTIGEHTEMVLTQFERYFAHSPLPGDIDVNFFRILIALHDIGKPEAIRYGNKSLQHRFTTPILEETLLSLGFGEKERKLAKALIDGDFVGKAIKTRGLSGVNGLVTSAKMSGLSVDEYFDALTIFYRVDAGSYTLDAGGKRSLDRLFIFDRENKRLDFAPDEQQIVDNLRDKALRG